MLYISQRVIYLYLFIEYIDLLIKFRYIFIVIFMLVYEQPREEF